MNDDEMMLYVDQDGNFGAYDDKYDIIIHCESEEERKKAMRIIEKANEILKKENGNES